MFKFELVESEDEIFGYFYYLEGNFNSKLGIIELDIAGESIQLVELA